MLLKAKLYYDNVLQKKGKVDLLNSKALYFTRDDKRYRWMFLEYLKINDTTNTIKMAGKWKAVFNDSDIKKIQKLKEKRSSKKRSTKKVSKKRSIKKVSKKRSIKKVSKKRVSKKLSKKLSKKRSTKRVSKKRSKKRSMKKSTIRKRHTNTSPSRERIRANRPSPSTGASSQKIGTVMKGNDGKMYKVIKTSSGTRRWKLLKKII